MSWEKTFKEKLRRIFDLENVSFDKPGDSQEQEKLFVDVQIYKGRIKDGRETGHAQGRLSVFANSYKLPYGYFSKRIAAASPEDKREFFFFDFEESSGTLSNISERTVGFRYLFGAQYDPELGTLASLSVESNYLGS